MSRVFVSGAGGRTGEAKLGVAAGASETLTVVPTWCGMHLITIEPALWAAAVSSSPPAAHPPAARRALGRRPFLLMLITYRHLSLPTLPYAGRQDSAAKAAGAARVCRRQGPRPVRHASLCLLGGGRCDTGRLRSRASFAAPALTELYTSTIFRRPEQQAELGEGVVIGDVLNPGPWQQALAGCTHLVILTSAVPKMRPTENPGDPPEWFFEPGQEVRLEGLGGQEETWGKRRLVPTPCWSAMPSAPLLQPEQVDWVGQRSQIDLAVQHGVKQVVLISSMGVTQPNHPLNRIGNGKVTG